MTSPGPVGTIRPVSRLVPALLVLMTLIQLAFPYRGWMILLVGLGGAWLVGRVWAGALRDGLALDREARFQWSRVGDRMIERLTLVNTSAFPAPWIELIDQSSGPLMRHSRAFWVGRRTSLRWDETLVCRQRGRFVIGPTRLRTGDPFGLFEVEIELPETVSLLVLPPVIPWESIPAFNRGRDEEGRAVHALTESSVSAAQVRPYAPGDSLRRIHWPTSARLGELYIRQFERATHGDWLILIDSALRHHQGEGSASTFEDCVVLAASLAEVGFGEGRSIGLLGGGPAGLMWIPPRPGAAQRWELLAGLAEVQPGDFPLGDLITLAGSRLGRQASLMVITPSSRLADFELLLANDASGKPASAGMVILSSEDGSAAQHSRAAARQLQRHGLLTWVVGRRGLHELLRKQAAAQPPERAGAAWKRLE